MENDHREDMPMDHGAMMRKQHLRNLWAFCAVAALGAWLLTSPAVFGYTRSSMAWSDMISGVVLIVFGLLSLSARRSWARWVTCAAGIWLLFAPLVFWAPFPVAYAVDNLIGALVVAFSILVPGMPGMSMEAMMGPGPDVPPGWSYNPSSWWQRAPMIALAFLGLFLSRYLAAYEMGYIHAAWDPFFGEGTVKVLTSTVSRSMPVSDAGLGALAYTLEMLSGFMGDARRWRTMPWMVLMFFVLVVPLGVVHVVLVILQPVVVGYWCTVCLAAAFTMLLMIPLAVDEVVAMFQFMKRAGREGQPLWSVFWRGGTLKEVNSDERTPEFPAPPARAASAMVWGVSIPWTLPLSTVIGIGLMSAPSLLGTRGALADSEHLAGALILAFSVIATAEVVRSARWLNVLLGLWTVAAPWLLPGGGSMAQWTAALAGGVLILLSLPRGPIRERYDGWDRAIF